MSARVVYIGDNLQATGFALSGVQVFTPPARAEDIWKDLEQASDFADLIMLSDQYAQLLGSRLLGHLQRFPIPPVLRLPASHEHSVPVQETIKSARASLGLS